MCSTCSSSATTSGRATPATSGPIGRELELFWSKLEDKVRKGSDEKREMALKQERKTLSLLEDQPPSPTT